MTGTGFPEYSKSERIADGLVHLTGVVASIGGAAALVYLVTGTQAVLPIAAVVVYSLALVALFGISAAYHTVAPSPLKTVLRRVDQATIFVKIAATYTPFALVAMGGAVGHGLMAAVWGIAVFGFALKLFFPARLVRFSYLLYLGQGWAAVFVIGPFLAALSAFSALLLGLGGLLYTTGILFHLRDNMKYHNAIWHVFVLAGASCHFVAVLDTVALA